MNSKAVNIGKFSISNSSKVFIIAEAGANHNGSLEMAKDLVVAAKKSGADCIKFQTFSAAEFCLDEDKKIHYISQGKDVIESELEMFSRLQFNDLEWAELMEYCKKIDIQFLTTIQDPLNLKLMKNLGLEAIKIGSDDFDHIKNLTEYAKSGLPLILSKGMSDEDELMMVLNHMRSKIFHLLIVMHCVSLYPADNKYLNLNQIKTLIRKHPDVIWGFSDHSQCTLAPSIAVALGAKVIEKHFTLDHDLAGPDHWFSMDPDQFSEMVKNVRITELSLGDENICSSPLEGESRKNMRRRAIARFNLMAGELLTEEKVIFKRASSGMFISECQLKYGKPLKSLILKGTPISIQDIEI